MRVSYKHNVAPYVTGIERRIGLPFEDADRESDHYCKLRTCDVVHLPRFPYLVERYLVLGVTQREAPSRDAGIRSPTTRGGDRQA